MYYFSQRSLSNLTTAHPELQRLFTEVIKDYDCSIIEGFRGMEKQQELFKLGRTKTDWPNSKHNKTPSQAVDALPYPINYQDKWRLYHFAGYVMGMAQLLQIPLRWGGDWDGNKSLADETFKDLAHFELVGVDK